MEISRDSLMSVVKGTRMSLSMASDMRKLMANPQQRSMADVIAGLLSDALFQFTGEKLDVGKDFFDSLTMRALTHKTATDEEVTQMLLAEYWKNHPQQPKLHFPDREEMKKQAAQGCGYIAPDGSLL